MSAVVVIQQLETELRRQCLEVDRDLSSVSSVSSRRSEQTASQYDLNRLFGDQTSTVF